MRLYQVLSEAFLIEYDQSKTLQALGGKLAAAARKDKSLQRFSPNGQLSGDDSAIAQYALQELERADPTRHKEYVQWLARTYAKAGGATQMEDVLSRGGDALEAYDAAKKKRRLMGTARDINTIKDLNALLSVVEALPSEEESVAIDKGKSKVVYEDSQCRVIHLYDIAAAKYYGQGTRWCTAAKNNNMYEYYANLGKIYVMFGKGDQKGDKIQIHFEKRQFMDPADDPVDPSLIWKTYPGMYQFFKNGADHKDSTVFREPVDYSMGAKNIHEAVKAATAPIIAGDLGLTDKQLYSHILSIYATDMNDIEKYEKFPWSHWIKEVLPHYGSHIVAVMENLGLFSPEIIANFDQTMENYGTHGDWVDNDPDEPDDQGNDPELVDKVRKGYRVVSQYLGIGGFGKDLLAVIKREGYEVDGLDEEGGYPKYRYLGKYLINRVISEVAKTVHNSGKEYK